MRYRAKQRSFRPMPEALEGRWQASSLLTAMVPSGAPGNPGGTDPGPVMVADPTAGATTSSSSPNDPATTTTLSVAPNPAVVGQTVTFTATVSSTGGNGNSRPQGTVQFKDGSTLLGTGTLNGGKTLDQATFSTSSLAQGTHPNLTAQYLGQGSYSGSPPSSPVSLTVNPAPVNSQDVTTYHFNSARNGWLSGFQGSPGSANWGKYQQVTVPDGTAVRGAPLVLMNHTLPDGTTHNLILVATSGNYAYAYTEDQLRAGNTTPLWQASLGTPRTATSQDIPPPIGVTSTGVIDPATGRWYLVADEAPSSGDNGSNGFFKAFALDVNTGTVLDQANLSDPQNGAPGRPTFNGNYQDQRGALNLVNGRVYATFATYQVETSNPLYHGWVVSLSASSLASNQVFFPMTTSGPYPVAQPPPGSTSATNYLLGGGIWGPGGVSFDGTHILVSTGNTPFAGTNNGRGDDLYNVSFTTYPNGPNSANPPENIGDHYIDVTALSVGSSGALSASTATTDWFAPQGQQSETVQDLDLSGSSVLVLPTIGGRNMAVVSGKDGEVYLLDRNNLGGSNGQLWVSPGTVFTPGADEPGGSKCAAAYYHDSSTNTDYVFLVGDSAPGLVAYKVVGGSSPSLSQVWSAGSSIGFAPGSPVVTDNGSGTVLVWTATQADGGPGQLLAYDAKTGGAPVYNSANVASDAPGATTHFPAITVTQTSVYLATTSGFAAYGTH